MFAVDFQLLLPYRVLRDEAHRRAIVETLRGLPFENLWVRIDGFGADATGVAVRRCISALADFHALDRPVVADYAGGLAALALSAFGAIGAISHGAAEKERFDAGGWKRPSKPILGGQTGRLYLPGLDRFFKLQDASAILAARGGRILLACADRDCCPRGLDDMLKYPKAHFLTQRRKQIEDLERVPDLRRSTHFLDQQLVRTDRTARRAAALRVEDERLRKALARTTQRLDLMRTVLEELENTMGIEATRSTPIAMRASVQARLERLGGHQ